MRVLWIILVAVMLVSCGSDRLGASIDARKFDNSKYNFFLAFDLAFDRSPKGALIVKKGIPEGHYTANINLKMEDVQLNEDLLSAVGRYNDYVLIDFDVSSSSPEISAIPFVPVLPDFSDNEIRNYGFQDGAYLLRRGLERQFIFNYEKTASIRKLSSTARSASEIKPQSVAVNLPEGAKGIEIRSTRKTSSPDPIYVENGLYFYPYSKPSTGEKHIEIRYMLQETPAQELIVDGLIKLILVLIPSGMALMLIKSTEIISPKLRRNGLYFCGIMVVLAILGLLVYSFYFDSKVAQKSFVDIGIAVVAAIFAALVFFAKKGEDQL